MIDNIIPQRRVYRSQPVVNYRPDEAALYARRIVRVSEEGRSREALQQPLPDVPLRAYRSFDIDDVLLKITEIESEGSTVGQPTEIQPSGVLARYVSNIAPLAELTGSLRMQPIVDNVRTFHLGYVQPAAIRTASWVSSHKLVKVVTQKMPKIRLMVAPRYMAASMAAALVLAFTGYISIDTWVVNNEVKRVVADQQVAGDSTARTGLMMSEGEDETDVAPSTVDSYTVAPDLPRVLSIDKIGVRARVLPMSVNSDGSLQAPVNIFDSGWYGASAKPGNPGAGVIDAHASGATREGLFAYLDTLVIGDTISIERGDGQSFRYEVVHTESVPLDQVDMKKVLKVHGGASEGMNLITCSGKWLPEKKTYDHRVLVYTQRV